VISRRKTRARGQPYFEIAEARETEALTNACAACRDELVQAAAPPHLIEAGIPTEGLLAQIAVAKYADGLPLYRQEAIYGREHIELPRNLMAGRMGRIGFHLERERWADPT